MWSVIFVARSCAQARRMGWVKLQVCFPDHVLESLFDDTSICFDYMEKHGPVPQSALERDAQKLLDRPNGVAGSSCLVDASGRWAKTALAAIAQPPTSLRNMV